MAKNHNGLNKYMTLAASSAAHVTAGHKAKAELAQDIFVLYWIYVKTYMHINKNIQ